VTEGDKDAVTTEHLALVRAIDKAASHGALHKNTAARKKARAARIASGAGS
jgi:ribosomal protein S20